MGDAREPKGWVDPSYEHHLRIYVSDRSALVSKPVMGQDGNTWFQNNGSWISVYPYVAGDTFSTGSAWRERNEAAVLAELHQYLVETSDSEARPGYPPLRDQDWRQRSQDRAERRVADLGQGKVPIDTPALEGLAELSERLKAAFSFVRTWTAAAVAGRFGGLSFAPIHGDYGPHNVVVADDAIISVLDWDDCRPEWLGWEVARAAWQFAPSALSGRGVAKTEFVRNYIASGGPVGDNDLAALDALLRCVLVS